MDPSEHSLATRVMAKRCETCPICRHARAHPETRLGRVMAWHGTWCPFWKAHEQVYSEELPPAGGPAE